MQAALHGLGALLVLVTALSFVKTERWWIRVWDYPRPQIAALTAVVLAVDIFTTDPDLDLEAVLIVLLLACVAVQLVQIYPYTPLARQQVPRHRSVPSERHIRILIANVYQDNRRADGLLAMVEREHPDLVFAVETDGWWDERLMTLAGRFRHVLRQPQDNTYGLHLFSLLQLRETECRFLVEPGIPSVRAEVQLRSGDWIEFYGLHPRPPRPAEDTEERDAELLIVGREAKADPLPAIVAGDLNDVAWSHTTRLFQRISGLLDPRVGRGLYSTFHAKIPFLRWPLDHLFSDPAFTLVELRRLEFFGSDHFPVLVELAYEPEAAAGAETPRLEPGDRMEAMRKIVNVFPTTARARLRTVLARSRNRLRRRRRRDQ